MVEPAPNPARPDDDRQAFLSYLPQRIEAFEQRIRRYTSGGWEHSGMLVLRGDVQRLADASGRHEVIATQRHLQQLAQDLGEHITRMSKPSRKQSMAMLEQVTTAAAALAGMAEGWPLAGGDALRTAPSAAPTAGSDAAALALPAGASVRAEPTDMFAPDEPPLPAETGLRRIYQISDDNEFANELAQRLRADGYAVETLASFHQLFELVLCVLPHVILVDPSHLPELAAVGNLRREAQQRLRPQRHIHLVAMAVQGDIATRRDAHRAGVDLLLAPPFQIDDTASRLLALHATAPAETARVLIVEDNRADAFYAQTVLTKAGMQAFVEHDPRRVIESLEVLHPDLVLMDLHMPYANGVEVTMLIRNHPVLARLPIVFLSGESDPDSQLEAANAGGDEFLFKPIRPQRLIAAVRDRMRHMHPPRGNRG
ncbi:MAG: response regulator [Proteobacteria bacterium]|nr:response regulator [Pseudomonadota bacterium]